MRVFNVPVSVPFLRTVIAALLDGRLIEGFNARHDPEKLAEATIYLPTRRAGRLARDLFLDELKAEAALLPRIVALGDIDEDELAFAQATHGPAALEIPPALEGLQRRFLLAQLIAGWARQIKPGDPAQASLVTGGTESILALADDLARLMDDFATRKVSWKSLDGLVPDALDPYWQLTLRFLNLAKDVWPEILRAHGRIEPAERRDRLIAAEAERLMARPRGPVIAAGSTGSMPATATFLQAVANLPQGAVVLPGLDTDLDDEAWQLIGGVTDTAGRTVTPPSSSHPQFAMHGLLRRLGIKRSDVSQLGEPHFPGREVLASESMRPANATSRWHQRLAEPLIDAQISAGMAGMTVIEAANPEAEALAIAVVMREAQHLGISAALVTPDRALARRVGAALGRWNLAFDDSGGDSLMDTPAGIFARLAAETALKRLEPPTLLALLKHPLCRLGEAEGAFREALRHLELTLLRGTRPPPGSDGLQSEFARFRLELTKLRNGEPSSLHRSEMRARLSDQALDRVPPLLARLKAALAPLENPARGPIDFSDLAERHRQVLIELSRDEQGTVMAFAGQDGTALADAFESLADLDASSRLLIESEDYPQAFQVSFGDHIVRRPETAAASLRIYGPLEARLTEADRVILGGLVEGIWPPAPPIDPWLSRPMRQQLGLDLPERRIGLSAHDLAQLLGTREVILSHAAKVGGSPAVASRFLHRLETVAGEANWQAAKARGLGYVELAQSLDRPSRVEPIAQPAPTPPVLARPQKLSVTAIEDWLRDPYTIYAKFILGLSPLQAVDMPLSAADRGSAIHDAIGAFTQAFPVSLPDDPERVLRALGEKSFAPLMERPEARALWWPRFQRIARWFAGWETSRRSDIQSVEAEIQGEISVLLANGRRFVLTARADRIERRHDGTFAILDYKTGQPPTGKQVRLGLSPQLTLEAAILRGGGFPGIPAGASVAELIYVRLSGNNPPGEPRLLELKVNRGDPPQLPDDAADDARRKLEELIRVFENESQAYTSLNLSMWTNRYGDYDDLARIKEWSAAGGMGIEEW